MESRESVNVVVKDVCWKFLTLYFLRVRIWGYISNQGEAESRFGCSGMETL